MKIYDIICELSTNRSFNLNILRHDGNGEISLIKNEAVIFNSKFKTVEEALCIGILKALKETMLILNFEKFPKHINQQLDSWYGQSFTNKFQYATHQTEDFIEKMIDFAEDASLTIKNKMIYLLSPLHKIYHDDCLKIKIRSNDFVTQKMSVLDKPEITQNMKTNSFIFKSENFQKPSVSFFTDASVKNKTFLAGVGVSEENVVVSFRKEYKTKNNNLAEIKAIHHAVLIAKEMDLSHLEIFTDSSPAVTLLNAFQSSGKIKENFVPLVKEIINEIKLFESYQIAWIPRNKNKLADKMSKVDFLETINRI